MSNRSDKQRKSLLALKRSPVAWIRFNLKVIPSESKNVIFQKITRAMNTGAKVGIDFIVGANSITRFLERDFIAAIAVCRDSNHILTDHIIEAARLRRVPIVILPRSVQELASLLQLKSISCLAIKKQNVESSPKKQISRVKRQPFKSCYVEPEKSAETEDCEKSVMRETDILDKCDNTSAITKARSSIERTDDEIAAALILPAVMDDLRDILIGISSKSS
jgi:ribosomal protein L30E